ncbi:MAG: OprO/OprP family phosphate-selective porin [Rhodopirellula sp. JB044]|uniref:OprO/OprP family phosphate-selective porin n=1 Tax=Rhodopirellula sp. JB044 TaxID=3342844 RepID=UPI00370A2709
MARKTRFNNARDRREAGRLEPCRLFVCVVGWLWMMPIAGSAVVQAGEDHAAQPEFAMMLESGMATGAVSVDGGGGGEATAKDAIADELADLQRQIDELWERQNSEHVAAARPAEPFSPIVIESHAATGSHAVVEDDTPKYPRVRLSGLLQTDAAWFSQDAANRALVGDVQDGSDFRRTRLSAVGKVWDNIGFCIDMDFGFGGRPSFADVRLDIEDVIRSCDLRIGYFRQPIGMDVMTSAREMTFLERALPATFLPFRQTGAMLSGVRDDELATWAVSGYRFPSDAYGGNVGDNGGYAMASRATAVVLSDDDQQSLLHIGGAYSLIDPANDVLRYRSTPEIFIGESGGGVPVGVPSNLPPFVDTGEIATEHVQLFGAEMALVCKSLYLQSEAVYSVVEQQAGSTLIFPGAYAHGGYFLTGETRAYNGKGGVFGRVIPNKSVGAEGGIGAWEIAGRCSYIDLSDKNIQGGRMSNFTAGLNWYLNPRTKLQLNYIFANVWRSGESEAGIFATRAQIDF